MRGAAMSFRAGLSGLVFLLLAAAGVMELNTWGVNYPTRQICAIKGSTVDIPCTFSDPTNIQEKTTKVQSHWWFKESDGRAVDLKSDLNYRRRVEYYFNDNNCTLRITDLRKSDSAEYKFRFTTNQPDRLDTTSPGVTLSVTDLQVETTRSGSYVELKCRSSCDTGFQSYIWKRNKQKIMERSSHTVYYNDINKYSCGVKGHEDYPSAEVYAPTSCSVSTSPTGEIKMWSEVTLTCSCDGYPGPEYGWYKDNHHGPLSTESQHVFRSIQSSDSGHYFCWAKNDLGARTSTDIYIDVKYAPKPPTVSVSPSGEILEGTMVTLTCNSDADPPPLTYTWNRINPPRRLSTESQHVFSSIQSSDSGRYSCETENNVGERTSTDIDIDVRYAPRQTSASVSPPGDVVEGSSVTLTCQSDANPAPAFTWYKKKGNQIKGGHQLHLSSITSSDSAEYSCEAKNKHGKESSSWIHINVKYAPKPPSVSVSPSAEVVEGTPVNLTCSSDANPAANYTWYKNSGPQNLSHLQSGPLLTFSSFNATDSGEYFCEAENELGTTRSKLISVTVKRSSLLILNIIRVTVVIFMFTLLIPLNMWMRKKKIVNSSDEPNRPAEMMELNQLDPVYEDI